MAKKPARPRKKHPLAPDLNRALELVGEIGPPMTSVLAPQILRLRAASNAPITLLIDSPGGSVYDADAIWNLLKMPDESGRSPRVVGVAMARALSSAAHLLSRCDHAVAYPHSEIHIHGTRFLLEGEAAETEESAEAARAELQMSNRSWAARLAHHMFHRALDNYARVEGEFSRVRKDHPAIVARYDARGKSPRLDLPAFALALFEVLHAPYDDMVLRCLDDVHRWRELAAESEAAEARGEAHPFAEALAGRSKKDRDLFRHRLGLLHALVKSAVRDDPGWRLTPNRVRSLADELEYLLDVADHEFRDEVLEVLIENAGVFFSEEDRRYLAQLDESKVSPGSKAEKRFDAIVGRAYATVHPLWTFGVSICRALHRGENPIEARDAFWLGLIDEVKGSELRRGGA